MNRYRVLFFVFFLFFLLSISHVYAFINDMSLLGKVIYLDAGHGGRDSGAVYNDILEKDINLVIVKKIENELVSKGAIVYLTRDADTDLSTNSKNKKRSDLKNRAYLINKSDCDMYISIHLNYINDSRWKGLQIFYNDNNKINENIAINMTNYLKENMKYVRDYKKDNSYYLYKLINKPGVLIELGFLSNPDDRYRLTKEKYQDILVYHLVNSIINILNS